METEFVYNGTTYGVDAHGRLFEKTDAGNWGLILGLPSRTLNKIATFNGWNTTGRLICGGFHNRAARNNPVLQEV